MTIRNAQELGTSRAARDAIGIIRAAMRAADPSARVAAHISSNTISLPARRLDLGAYRRVCLIAYGKAAATMAAAADRNASISDGIVIVPEGLGATHLGSKYTVLESSHPIPSAKSVSAARTVLERIGSLTRDDFALFLVSGGGSAMLAAPRNVRLGDKACATRLLIQSGANISEINCVRRRLSSIKGGRLLSGLACKGAALLISDVRGNRPYDIASGCTQRDPTTFADALDVIKRYHLAGKMPKRVISALKSGARAHNTRAPTRRIPNLVIASNHNCVLAMAKAAKKMGYAVKTRVAYDDVDIAAHKIAAALDKRPMSCVVFGGEPTLKVKGRGRGGRSHELVARILDSFVEPGIVVASVGTDGMDGNSGAAGALAESASIKHTEIKRALTDSDSGTLFARHSRQVIMGHTGTNLQDVGVLVRRN